MLYTCLGVTGIGGQKPGNIGWIGQRGGVEHDTPQELSAAFALDLSHPVWVARGCPESRLVFGETVRLQLDALASGIPTQQYKVSIIGDQHLTIGVQIPGDLGATGNLPDIITRALHLHDTTCWPLRMQIGLACARQLVGGKEATIRKTTALIFQIDNTAYSRLECPANLVEQIGQRTIE